MDASTLGDVQNIGKLKELGQYETYKTTSAQQCIERLQGCHVAITNKVIIDRKVMDSCPDLELICIAATGMNNVDLEYAAQKGISVKNVAGYSSASVAQSTFAMLFHLLHHNRYYDDYVKAGEYIKSPIFTHFGDSFWELKNKRFGIIGLGTIGKSVATIASAFGSNVVYYSTSGNNTNTNYPCLPLKELLSSSDVVSIHCPLNDKTKNLIGREELKMMKPTAFLLNLGRGGIVDEKALADAIDQNLIAGAGIDVLTNEPIKADNHLLHIKNKEKIFITPHTAWASVEARALLVEKLADNIKSHYIGK